MSRVGEDSRASLRFQRDGAGDEPDVPAPARRRPTTTSSAMDRAPMCWRTTPAGVDPIFEAMPLRFLGGVHRIVLEGRAPDLARATRPPGARSIPTTLATSTQRFLAAVEEHRDELIVSLTRGVQTNEVGRCAALLLGFLAVARETGLPLRVLEVGASAGLNLRWDRYRYEGGADGRRGAIRLAPSVRGRVRRPVAAPRHRRRRRRTGGLRSRSDRRDDGRTAR